VELSVSGVGTHQDGLDVTRPDETTAEEIAAYRAQYLGSNKGLLDSFEFWLEFRPDVLKRHKARTRHFSSTAEPHHPLVGVLGALHHYAVRGFADGVAYEARLAQTLGASRTDILDTLSVAFIHAGHPGMFPASRVAGFLRDYVDPPASADRFPAGWSFDPHAFDSGMDFSTREATGEDVDRLRDWYRTTLGEIPPHVEFLARWRPSLLKAYRDRYEHAIRDSLPQQMLPVMLLNRDVVRGFRAGIREHALLGRAVGVTREQLLNAICYGVLHGGLEVLAIADEAAGDVLAEMA
jgi:hypothetical protein